MYIYLVYSMSSHRWTQQLTTDTLYTPTLPNVPSENYPQKYLEFAVEGCVKARMKLFFNCTTLSETVRDRWILLVPKCSLHSRPNVNVSHNSGQRGSTEKNVQYISHSNSHYERDCEMWLQKLSHTTYVSYVIPSDITPKTRVRF